MMTTRSATKPPTAAVQQIALGYCRVSTDRQGGTGYGLEAQRQVIDAEITHRKWTPGRLYVDVASGGSMKKRPELEAALEALDRGEAQVLVVAKLDRLSRSQLDFASLMARGQRSGWSVVALDIGVDTSTINGELVASIIMALAQWERRMIGQRTRDALAVVSEQGTKLGRPITLNPETQRLIQTLRADGQSYRAVARLLNQQGFATAQGGQKWHASTVRAVERRVTDGEV